MYEKLCVGLVFGGCSLEHEISLKSAIFILRYIDRLHFDIKLIYFSKNGDWFIDKNMILNHAFIDQNKSASFLLKNFDYQCLYSFNVVDFKLECDVVFSVVHGTIGEDGTIQGLLNILDIPFVGSDILGSAISMDKDITKRLLRDSGLPIVPFQVFFSHNRNNIWFENLVSKFGLPFFIKPSSQGSSIGISKVFDIFSFKIGLDLAFKCCHKILIEPAVIGRELECAVLGNNDLEISRFGEIIVNDSDFYTYNKKYLKCCNVCIKIPASIDHVINIRLHDFVIRAFQVLNCTGMARVDFFLTIDNEIFINEVNTIPGFTDVSMYPRLWRETGLNSKDLITKLIYLAIEAHDKKIKCV